jgi:hypothetical protein
VPIELIFRNHRPRAGVITRNTALPDEEMMIRGSMRLTTVERTAFDLALSGRVGQAVARLDALASATHFKNEGVQELARRHPRYRGIRRLDKILELVDAGAESPQETRVRLLLLDNEFPRPETQIPVPGPDGLPRYYLDMRWEDIMVAVEYDGEHHRKSTADYRKDIILLEYIQSLGWIVVRVVAGIRPRDVVERVRRAHASRLP